MDTLWEKKDWDALADLQVHVWADGPSQPEGRAAPNVRNYIRQKVLADLTRQDGEATALPLEPRAINRLGEIRQPTLIMVGEFDTTDTLAAADELECQVPLARKVGVPGVAHMIPMEQPALFNQVVLGFLKEVL
jgi:pimeloyl-ACP methyl ester carboxylesterase